MVEFGAVEFTLQGRVLPRDELERLASGVFDTWDAVVADTLPVPDYSLSLEIEEGSLKAKGVVLGTLLALFEGISRYGDIVQGLQTMRRHARYVADALVTHTEAEYEPTERTRLRRSGGVPAGLGRLFERVRDRSLSVDEAMAEARELLGADADEVPQLMVAIRDALVVAPKSPEQLFLPMEIPDLIDVSSHQGGTRSQRVPGPRPAVPPPERLQVVVWRESRGSRKVIRVRSL